MWLKVEGFKERVKEWWNSYHIQGTPSFILVNKLKALKGDLETQNENEFGNVLFKNQLIFDLKELDA